VPRHPVQLYEAVFYALLFFILLRYFKRHVALKNSGRIAGLFFFFVFSFRFCIEWVKVEQSRLLGPGSALTMGQYLSLPAILFGLYLLFHSRRKVDF
jgi:phosphatidylglycerol---prolipoprotein diacylglyceryl transferase